MAATNYGAAVSGSQSLLFGRVLSFALTNGDTGIIAPEERRTYDHIIHSNVGAFPAAGLTESQVHSILSKSHLPEDDLEQVWQLAITVEVEELQDGNWTPLEVYVALHYAQAYERLALNEMAIRYTGSLPPVLKKKVARRSSYAKARSSTLASADAPPMPTASASASASGPLRTQSLAETHAPPVSNTLRHTYPAASIAARDRRRHSSQTSSTREDSSVGQAGLEAVNEVEVILRESSVRSDTVDRAQRLASLIKARCPEVTVNSDIQPQEPRVRHASIADRTHAHDILVRGRRESPSFKDPTAGMGKLLQSKESKQRAQDTHTWTFSGEEKSHALREAVETGYVGVAEALLAMGTDVNAVRESAKSKILRTKTTTARPTNYIQIAASSNNFEMVNLLASHGVSQRSLAEALEQAVRQNLPNVVLALLQSEADPNAREGTIFQAAITSQKPEIVKLLLRARVKVVKAYLTASLPVAVSQGHSEIVSLLVAYGADVNDEHASALRKAVQAQRVDLVLTIMRGKPSRAVVSVAFEDAFSANSSITLPEKYLLIEILLCGGAQGDCVAETLVRVVRAGHRNIARLLVLHGASLQFERAEALRIAIAAGNIQLVDILMVGNIPKNCATDLFNEIPRPYTDNQTYDLMSALIFKGATGTPLDEALVAAVQQKSVRITGLLLDHKADADYNDAQALQIAASAGDLSTVDLLLSKGRPRPHSMQHVLPLVPHGPPRLRYEMAKSIIDAASSFRIPTSVLDVALMQAIDPQSQQVDLNLVNLLVVAGANVDCLKGKCFQLATKQGSLELLELLVANMSLPSSLSSAVPEAMRGQQPALRRKLMALLLDHGAQGPTVSQALIDGMEENPVDEGLVLSLLAKANVDYRGGQALLLAMRCTRTILSSMIDLGKPNQQSLVAALSMALESATRDRQAKLDLLLKAGIDQKGLDNTLVQEISNGSSYSMTIVKTLLRHHASCNHEGGKPLELAIRSRDSNLLEQLVGSKPDRRMLGDMVLIAMDETDSSTKYRFVASLLHGGARGDMISHALAQEVCDARDCDPQLVRLLIQHNAKIDYSEGLAIKRAVSVPLDIDLLRILVEGNEASRILPSLIPLAMAHPQDVRLPLLQLILEKSVHVSQIDAALVDAVLEGPPSQKTIDILLHHNASVDFENAKAIKQASSAGNSSILQSLLDKNPNPEHLTEALRHAMQAPATQTSPKNAPRLACVKLITRAGVGNPDAMDQALVQAVREQDHDLVKHLIDNGADPNFDNGTSVIIATEQADIASLALLDKAKPTPYVYSNAFSVITNQKPERQRLKPELLFNIDRILLSGGASGPAVDEAFIKALTSRHPFAVNFVDMVLKCRSSLDVNFHSGKSLCLAAKKNFPDVVKRLLGRVPSEETLCSAFMSALESNAGEVALIKMVEIFLEHSNETKNIYFGRDDAFKNPFYQVLHRHADKPGLLQCLLDNGCRTDAQFSWQFMPEHGVEQTSGLLWLLYQADQMTDSRTVKILLERGADPNFRTSGSGNSPLIVAAALPRPDLVLLLLQSGARAETEDSLGGTPLHYATRAGCLNSMKHLLNHNADPNDESLHIAARHTRVDAVKLLVDHGVSINYPGILSCDGRTPLGEICRCADPENDPAQLKETLKELAKAQPNPKKLPRDKSLVILALDNNSPLAMTRILLTVLLVLRENLNEEFNIYRQTGGLCYSPTMYVRHFKCIHQRPCLDHEHRCCQLACPAPALEKLLRAHGCQDRYWNDTSGANQPAGACGWPGHISEARQEAEIIRKQQKEQARLRAEEQATREAKQAALDADAAAERQREVNHLEVIERKRRADAREDQRRLEVAEEKRKADAREERQRLAAIEAEHKAQTDRERRAFEEQQERMRTLATQEETRKKRQDNQNLVTLKEQTKLEKEVLKERKKLIDGATELVRQTQIAGVGGQAAGRILGEIEGGRMRYLE